MYDTNLCFRKNVTETNFQGMSTVSDKLYIFSTPCHWARQLRRGSWQQKEGRPSILTGPVKVQLVGYNKTMHLDITWFAVVGVLGSCKMEGRSKKRLPRLIEGLDLSAWRKEDQTRKCVCKMSTSKSHLKWGPLSSTRRGAELGEFLLCAVLLAYLGARLDFSSLHQRQLVCATSSQLQHEH